MPTLTSTDADILMKTLDTQVKAGSWRALLELFAYTGVVDMIQIQDSLSLVRDKARGLLDQVIASRGTMPLIIEKLEKTPSGPGRGDENQPSTGWGQVVQRYCAISVTKMSRQHV